jgi:hypothetical protein
MGKLKTQTSRVMQPRHFDTSLNMRKNGFFIEAIRRFLQSHKTNEKIISAAQLIMICRLFTDGVLTAERF